MKEKDDKEKNLNPDDYFPRFLTVKDNHGNEIQNPQHVTTVRSEKVLREGDTIEFQCDVINKTGSGLEYNITRTTEEDKWTSNGKVSIKLERRDVGKAFQVKVMMRSKKDTHAYGAYDDYVMFMYIVVPKEEKK